MGRGHKSIEGAIGEIIEMEEMARITKLKWLEGINKKKREDFEHQEVLEASRNLKEGTEGKMKKILKKLI